MEFSVDRPINNPTCIPKKLVGRLDDFDLLCHIKSYQIIHVLLENVDRNLNLENKS